MDPARIFTESLTPRPELENTLIRQRHLTPSCGGHAPTAERTMDPARIFTESLTPRPELENSQGQSRPGGTQRQVPPFPLCSVSDGRLEKGGLS
jgi:hypothetical protein